MAGGRGQAGPPGGEPIRRDFLTLCAGSFVAVGAAATVWPLIDQMNPNPATPPPETATVDLARIGEGQSLVVRWRGSPVVVRHRTAAEIARARAVPLAALRDPLARNARLPERTPATDANRTRPADPRWLVVVAVCTHLGCSLRPADGIAGQAEAGGWLCPCHAARFDAAGRVVAGPAATNLAVPPWRFAGPGRIEIGAA